jgi:membrane protein implicated in regulation of membrane protease activity
VGQTGVVVRALEPTGLIALGETEYRATAEPGARALVGDEVTVLSAYGKVLKVAHRDSEPVVAEGWRRRFVRRLRLRGR